MKAMDSVTVNAGCTISLKTVPPDANVTTYGAKLFALDETGQQELLQEWDSSALEAGRSFTMSDNRERDLVLAATATAATSIQVMLSYNPPPPPPKTYSADCNAGLNEFLWQFFVAGE